jgi:hypothetical protein
MSFSDLSSPLSNGSSKLRIGRKGGEKVKEKSRFYFMKHNEGKKA